MQLNNYYSSQQWQKIQDFAAHKPSPFLVVDLDRVEFKYQELQQSFPMAHIFYAVKANPSCEVLRRLDQLGSYFDVASVYELDRVIGCGISPERISFGNTIKKAADVKYAYDQGVRLFVTDAEADLEQISQFAPSSRVFVRVLVESGTTSDWPLSRKFGCDTPMAIDLMVKAKQLGLQPYGVSFHVGSQQNDVTVWRTALKIVKEVFDTLEQQHGIQLELINAGGGFPAQYLAEIDTIQDYAQRIKNYINESFQRKITLFLEPGRSLVGDAGVIVSEIVLISNKSEQDDKRWIYTDVGVFNGLIETLGEMIKYPIYTPKMQNNAPNSNVVLAGPTCDSTDIMYEKVPYQLPQDLKMGDRLYWLSTGAYTTSYASVEFNGYPPLRTFYLE
ncbi:MULTISPECIES: type III PLP-dependent enzyme [Acinetobacter]|uniref:ornithine decarboxylase n=1 Tax=Acinetobacter entericus TaxID=2989714 RepID=A0ABT3NKF6_9GAMM|nr:MULTISPECIES: type III PLP-dependent enzyme [Acinetobacter]MCW8040015.1 type III PLP-dependent enzyme [Acinetobacter entericus]TCB76725.1 type III PLP-dependent enzyme [Acinetobacter sp. ANC 4177]